jgi:starch-binding outer membrane protein, SusD/RagB family
MRTRGTLPPLVRRALLGAGLGAALTGCSNLDVTNPNQPSTATFWRTQSDAGAGTSAVYAGLLPLGTYGRWQAFNFDIRSDIGTARLSPWGDLANFNQFILNNYNFDININTWTDHYNTIFRANQVIANVPKIQMDAALRARYVGEAKFIRALLYYNLVNLYGGNIPLVLEPPADQTVRPPSSTAAAVYAQIETDLTDAAAALPAKYGSGDVGRATKGAALALLGKAQLQQHKWSAAETTLLQLVNSSTYGYSLLPNYADNFIQPNDATNPETIFDVQSGDESTLANNIPGLSFPRMIGPCRFTYCDGRPTTWYYQQFLLEKTATGGTDPRLDATLYYRHATTERPYGHAYDEIWNGATDSTLYFKKYGEYYAPADVQRWDNPINYKVIRYADVLLSLAEAQNEQGKASAKTYLDMVRQRAGLLPYAGGLTTAAMRDEILHQRLLEFGLEGQRWFDLVRQNLLSNPAVLATHDPDFAGFTVGKSELLPIPVRETNLNQGVKQNPGW